MLRGRRQSHLSLVGFVDDASLWQGQLILGAPVLGTVRQIRSPLRMPGAAEELKPAPKRGEHTRQVLHDLAGIDDAEIDALAEAGAFGDVEV